MKLHTDTVTGRDLLDACVLAHTAMERWDLKGSRTRDHSWDVIISGSSPRRMNMGNFPDVHAATWDEWGIFLGHLFEVDPRMHCYAYMGRADYDEKTNGRFTGDDRLLHRNQCPDHKWDHSYVDDGWSVSECRKCGALQAHAVGRPRIKPTRGGFTRDENRPLTRAMAEEFLVS